MKPEDVPADLASLGREALYEHLTALPATHLPTFEERARAVLAAALPEHERQLLAERDALKAAIAKVRADCEEQLAATGPRDEWAQARRTLRILAALDGPPDRRALLRDLTQDAIDAGTYGEPAPTSAPESPAERPTTPHPTREPHEPPGGAQ